MITLILLALFFQTPPAKPNPLQEAEAKVARENAERNAKIPAMKAEREKLLKAIRDNKAATDKRREEKKKDESKPPTTPHGRN